MQRYSIGLPPGKKVRAGDYVSISPAQCMTHDNSWPVVAAVPTDAHLGKKADSGGDSLESSDGRSDGVKDERPSSR